MTAPTPFGSLALHPKLLANLAELGYHQMTPIQAAALPAIIEGRDVVGKAKTGSGKTATFGLGLLNKLAVQQFRVQALVLCPTRELADQVATELRKLARAIHNIKILTLCGGAAFGPQVGSLAHGAHIVVGTPGRIHDHLRKENLHLEHVETLVLDEADRMLDMGFKDTVDSIIAATPDKRQTLLFSATYPAAIEQLAGRVQTHPLIVDVATEHTPANIEQRFYRVDDRQRTDALVTLISFYQPDSTVVFCNTKAEVQAVHQALLNQGFTAVALHGDLEQRDRDQMLVLFANNSASVLVATDVAARGLDIAELDLVVNYHLSRDPEVHVHRIGRTGRAGERGLAISLLADSEQYKLERFALALDLTIDLERLPTANTASPKPPAYATIEIDGGKKQKLRPGDIVGALTGEDGLPGDSIGKIHVFPMRSFVAVERARVKQALNRLSQGKLKGRSFRARILRPTAI